jgi:IS30 family transposase
MSNLTFYDRERIEFYLHFKRLSLRDIAKFIHRDVSVVSREIKRHKPQFSPYNAELAQAAANRKAKITNKKKLDKYEKLKLWVENQIRQDWSPEQIAGRLYEQPPPELKSIKVKTVCAETIYQHIYGKDWGEKLYKHLRTHRSKRFPRGKRKERLPAIPDKVSIHDRENIINNKERYGDMEADLLLGKKAKEAIAVSFERKSMHVSLVKMDSKKAETMYDSLAFITECFPDHFVKSITFDNGKENTKHAKLNKEYNIDTYFCDPFSPWQKGGVENSNKLLRQYIPKGTDLKTIDQNYLYLIAEKLNNRPRKTHNYLTPNEVLATVLKAEVLH